MKDCIPPLLDPSAPWPPPGWIRIKGTRKQVTKAKHWETEESRPKTARTLPFIPGERWRPVVGYSGYEVSDHGRVRSWRVGGKGNGDKRRAEPRLRKAVRNTRTGYLYVMLKGPSKLKLRQVHVMVLEAFVGPRPPRSETRHLDGDSANNRLYNLKWGTRRDQFDDQVRHKTDTRGERNGAAKLTNKQAIEIRKRLKSGERGSDLAREFGVLDSTITRIKKGVRYASAV